MKQPLTIEEIIQKATPVLRQHGVSRAALFGSHARGEGTANSDVDLLIKYGSDDKSLWDLISLEQELSEVFGASVDLGTEASLHGSMRPQVLHESKVIYG